MTRTPSIPGGLPQRVCTDYAMTQYQLMISPEAINEAVAVPGNDPIVRPNHYARYIIEPVTFIAANKLPFDVGNIVKYVLRFNAKNGVEDVKKARRYCDMLLERLDREARIEHGDREQDVWKESL